MKNSKRIHAVTIKRMTDTDPHTSYMGEYSDRAKTDYAIDRKHDLDCSSQTYNVHVQEIRTLKHAITYLNDNYLHGKWPSDSEYVDDCTDADEILGEALDSIGECDCGERGDAERNEYRYFNGVVENYKGETPEKIREYILRDYERMERLQRGDWCFVGIRAEAEILVPSGAGSIVQEITSGGLWGVESDSDREYLAEIETEELSSLREQLQAVGFSKRAISAAVKNATYENA